LPQKYYKVSKRANFLYFTHDIKKEMLGQIKDHLENNGLLIIGTNGLGRQSRYAVYKKKWTVYFFVSSLSAWITLVI